jgi:hypothetical protein
VVRRTRKKNKAKGSSETHLFFAGYRGCFMQPVR